MGYMGLDHALSSDNAANVICDISIKIVERLATELEEEEYCYDTNGVVAVALILEGLAPSVELWGCDENLASLLNKTIKKLEKKEKADSKEEWDSESNKQMHLEAYDRMLVVLRDFKEKLDR